MTERAGEDTFASPLPDAVQGLVRLIYQSVPTSPLGATEIDHLLAGARAFNAEHEVTGTLLLLHAETAIPVRFVQWIEGPAAAVEACFERIEADDRHTEIHVLAHGPARERAYANWSMRREWVTPEQLDAALRRFGVEVDP